MHHFFTTHWSSIDRLLVTAWVGSLWTVGYIAAPIIFSQIDNRSLAGNLVGAMLDVVAITGLVCGTAILVGHNAYVRANTRYRDARWLVPVMMLLVVIGHFALAPMISELRSAGIGEGSSAAEKFALLHGLASLNYLIVSLLGLRLVWTRS